METLNNSKNWRKRMDCFLKSAGYSRGRAPKKVRLQDGPLVQFFQTKHRGLATAFVLSALALPGLSPAQQRAEPYPSRPVQVVASIAPGGGIDQEARLYTTRISELLKQPFILDFKPGAGGAVGGAFVARAKPDGYTLLVVSGGFTVFPAFYKDLTFDIIRDFAPLAMMSQRISVLQSNPAFPAATLADYLAFAKANPGKINYGTTGTGSITHLAGAWLHEATATRVTFVPYKGTSPLTVDLLAGRVDVASAVLVTALPLFKAGKLRILAVMNDRRSRLLPEMPTMAEQGVAGYNYSSWMGFLAPAAIPAPVSKKLSDTFAGIARLPDIVATLEADGGVPVGSTAAEFRQTLITEAERWRKVVQATGITVDN